MAVGLLPGKKVTPAARPERPMDRATRAETGRKDVAPPVRAVAPIIVGPEEASATSFQGSEVGEGLREPMVTGRATAIRHPEDLSIGS